jgi:hypothetical protein
MAAAEQDRGLQSASQLDETTPAPTRNSQTLGSLVRETATVAAAVDEAAAEQPASGETAGGAEEVSALAAGAMLEGLRDWPDESDWGEVGDGLDFSDFDVASGFDSVQDASSEVAFQSDTLNALAESQQSSSMGQKQVNALEANDSEGSEGDEVANCLQKLQSSLGNALGLKPATAAKLTELVKVFGVFHTPVILT